VGRRLAVVGAVAVVTAGAAALRLADLGGQPGGLYPDEAAEGLDAHRLLTEPGFHPVFFHDDAGREALFAYLVAAAFRVVGESATVLRGVAGVVGVAGVLAVFLALRRFGTWVAIAAMSWAAGSLWLIGVARDGFRVILVPLAAALALAALIRWGDRPDRNRALLAGVAVGAGLWTYQPLKLTPLLVILWLWRVRAVDRERFATMRRTLWWAAAGYALIAFPMVLAAISDPGNYFGRGAAVTAFNPDQGPAALPLHALRTLAMFGFTGDPNPRHNVDGLPLLPLPLAVIALVGAWRAWRHRDDIAYWLILLGIPVFLIPALIATEGGTPHFLRTLGLMPFVAALIGLGCAELVEWGRERLSRPWAAGAIAALLGALLIAVGAGSAHAYFSRGVADRYDAYSFDVVALAEQAHGGPSTAVIVDDFSGFDVRFLKAASPPTVIDPGSRIADPRAFSRIVGRSQAEIAHSAGPELAARATVAARDPAGRAVVWVVAP
jgi:hypothetical protein